MSCDSLLCSTLAAVLKAERMSKLLRRRACGGVSPSESRSHAAVVVSVGGQLSCQTVQVGESGNGVVACKPMPSPLLLRLWAWEHGTGVVMAGWRAETGRGLSRNSASA